MATEGLTSVRRRLTRAAERSGRNARDVTLVVVTKGRTVEETMVLYEAGHRDFGENRPAELATKASRLPSDIIWHMVGTVQRRKVPLAGRHTSLLHSLDREALARSWAALDDPPPVLVQVNVASEPQKHGVDPTDVAGLISMSEGLGVAVAGLMIIPPIPEVPESSRRWFEQARALRDKVAVDHPDVVELSMGMTDDFEVAIESGSTLIRVGRAIFERRADTA